MENKIRIFIALVLYAHKPRNPQGLIHKIHPWQKSHVWATGTYFAFPQTSSTDTWIIFPPVLISGKYLLTLSPRNFKWNMISSFKGSLMSSPHMLLCAGMLQFFHFYLLCLPQSWSFALKALMASVKKITLLLCSFSLFIQSYKNFSKRSQPGFKSLFIKGRYVHLVCGTLKQFYFFTQFKNLTKHISFLQPPNFFMKLKSSILHPYLCGVPRRDEF